MRLKILSVLSFLSIWCCLVGISLAPLAIFFAVIIPLITFIISLKLNLLPTRSLFSWKLFTYVAWLIKEIFISTINVIKIAWRPHLKIIPVIEPIKSIQKCDEGLVLYANSITLTPGTVTLNIVENALLVHSLDSSIMEDLKEGTMDRKIAEVVCVPKGAKKIKSGVEDN